MNEYQLIAAFVIGIIIIFLLLDIVNKIKLKQQIKSDWGKLPRHSSKDSEESLLKAYSFRKKDQDVLIDDLTWHDLDMFEVFRRINLTYSSIGSEELYHYLRGYNLTTTQLDELETLISYFKEHPDTRETVSYRFARLGKKSFNYAQAYLNQETTNPFKHLNLYTFLGVLPIISLLSTIVIGAPGLIIAISSLCVNTVLYLIKKGQLEIELGAMNYLVQGLSLSNYLGKLDTPLKEAINQNNQTFKPVLKVAFAFRAKSGSESEMFIEMLSAAFLLPFISFGIVSKKMQKDHEKALELWELMGQLEVAIAVLNLRTVYGEYWCHPTFGDNGVIAEEVIHPLLQEPVPNPIHWQQSTLITGSNASGKSTYVRAVAINILFAQTLNTCLATSFQLQPGHVISSMGVQDSVIDGDSYFIAELKSLYRLIEVVETNTFCYCFIDEILKGTNTIERIAASSSILSWLTKQNQLAFVATHDIELPQILGKDCANIHFEETVSKEDGISFDYLLKEGVATSRNAINLIDSMNFPSSIITDSLKKAQFFDENRHWKA